MKKGAGRGAYRPREGVKEEGKPDRERNEGVGGR